MITQGMQVSLRVKMFDSEGTLVGAPEEAMVYVHGADEIFPRLEQALEGKNVGDTVLAYLEPEDHFGDYDAQLLRVEERSKFPEELQVGMQFEGSMDEDALEDEDHEPPIFRVTDITGDTVVLDGNHPLAGMALRFELEVLSVEQAPDLPEEDDDDDGSDDQDDDPRFTQIKRTLH
jgi:FKBP-type peptidyl-prolyl cis-trans isomerase SlyD